MALLDTSPADGAPLAASGITTVLSANQLAAIGVLSVEQAQGARVVVPFEADFTGPNNTTVIDLTLHQASFAFTSPRTLFFDNTANPSPVIVHVGQTTQEFPIPANAAGYFPIAAQNNSRISMYSVGGASAPCMGQLYNYTVPPQVWYEAGIPVVLTGSTPVIVENTPSQPVPMTAADGAIVTQGSLADPAAVGPITNPWSVISLLKGLWTTLNTNLSISRRGTLPAAILANTIAAGGTSVFVVQGPCQGGFIQNPYNATAQGIATAENLYINIMNTAPGSGDATGFGSNIILQPGGIFSIPALSATAGIRVNASTTGHRFTGNTW